MESPNTVLPEEDETIPKYVQLNEHEEDVVLHDQIEEDMSYLKSNKDWDKLKVPDALKRRLIQLGFKCPSKIQASVIPLSKKNSVFAQSQNGSGKTLAFLIPSILEVNTSLPTVTSDNKYCPQVIIIADTRPLIGQIVRITERLRETVFDDIRIEGLYSGKTISNEGSHIFITTITFLKNLYTKSKNIDTSKLKLLVVDEADKVMKSDMSSTFLPQLVVKAAPKTMRLILTTATSTSISKNFVEKIQEKKRIMCLELEKEQLTLKNVQQLYVRCRSEERFFVLDRFLDSINAQNILIFANTKRLLTELLQHLEAKNHKVVKISSNNNNVDRAIEAENNDQSIRDFLAGKYRILITTDLLSRGMDMRKVTLVVNLELPKAYSDEPKENTEGNGATADCETYLHRVGRTGRYGDHGIALNFVTNSEQAEIHQQIVNYYGIGMDEISQDNFNSLNEKLEKISEINTVKREQMEENI